ncbi:telomerase regulatory factor Ctr1 [Schizosaccharomyces osmophilus]|uniref:Telomerase regulatory factor Ctr1 n=1 Tax=Schizosaccharomyces osmophilus TaxID=2545709 RepID=A0AAE9WBE4_9SCHI|nr:telomerase regulatory factor Ctr1 [Schizosaccharomyces osmophilus]WBW73237.1 telomerase regulatory factor Ctr1 [Schizosaccharomyces osmophilus]
MDQRNKQAIHTDATSNLTFLSELAEEKARFEEERRQRVNNRIDYGTTNKRAARIKKDEASSSHPRTKRQGEEEAPRKKPNNEQKRRLYLKNNDENEEDLRRSKLGLEHKAQKYNQLLQDNSQITEGEETLVDFTKKWAEESRENEFIEVTDEFGRTRQVSIYEAGQTLLPSKEDYKPENVIRGEYMPEYEVDEQRIEDLHRQDEQQAVHYDASKEIRTKGIGFFQFSLDEKERKQQFESLGEIHEDTLHHQPQKMGLDILNERENKLASRRNTLQKHYERTIGEEWIKQQFHGV